jgi:hypothetical protein
MENITEIREIIKKCEREEYTLNGSIGRLIMSLKRQKLLNRKGTLQDATIPPQK